MNSWNILLYAAAAVIGLCTGALAAIALYVQSHGLTFRQWRGVFACTLLRKKMPIRYILTVLVGGVLALLCAFAFEFTLGSLCYLTFLTILIAVALVDLYTMEIPNGFVLAALAVGILSIFAVPGLSLLARLIGVFVVSVPMLLIAILIPGGFGGGDIKLMAACGVFLGWQLTLLSAFIGILLGGLYAIFLLLTKQKKARDHFAFAPFLCAGMALCCFFGANLLEWFVILFDFSRFF